MDGGLRPLAVYVSDRSLRGYIRYSPLRIGKQLAWKLYEQRFSWRTQRRIAATPFGFKVHVQLPDHIQKVIWLTGRWEAVLTEFVRKVLGPGDTLVDVGANIGYYSLLGAQIVGQQGRVYAIEASPTIYKLLQANVALNQADNIEPSNALVTDYDGEKDFWLSWDFNLGQSSSVPRADRIQNMRSEGRVRCAALTSLVPADKLLNARLLKIDVEGAERSVLEPLFGKLAQFSRRSIWAVELSPQLSPGGQADVDCIFDAFCRSGYRPYMIKNDYSVAMYLSKPRTVDMEPLSAAPTTQTDVIFLRD